MEVFWRTFILSVACSTLVACGKGADPEGSNEKLDPPSNSLCEGLAISDQFMVKWKNGTITREHAYDRADFIKSVLEERADEIEVAEHDYLIKLDTLQNEVQAASTPPDDDWGQQMIEANDVWTAGHKGAGVTVAVIDSGVDITHPELDLQLSINAGEIAGNGIDDDGNGFIDDVNGWDFYEDTGSVDDIVGHGSHVSGIIVANHSVGDVYGVAPESKLLPLNFMDENGAGSLSDAIDAIDYAVMMGATIINASWGGAPCSTLLQEKIVSLSSQGVLFVAAAGNSGLDLDVFPEYPAAFDLQNQITVGASTVNDFMAGFSNFSRNLVHLVAPGKTIYSTVPTGFSETLSGTSMAAPFVAGAAAVLKGAFPQATPAQIKQALLDSVDDGSFAVQTNGRLNLKKAYEALDLVL